LIGISNYNYVRSSRGIEQVYKNSLRTKPNRDALCIEQQQQPRAVAVQTFQHHETITCIFYTYCTTTVMASRRDDYTMTLTNQSIKITNNPQGWGNLKIDFKGLNCFCCLLLVELILEREKK
jgi:hypothetical protein